MHWTRRTVVGSQSHEGRRHAERDATQRSRCGSVEPTKRNSAPVLARPRLLAHDIALLSEHTIAGLVCDVTSREAASCHGRVARKRCTSANIARRSDATQTRRRPSLRARRARRTGSSHSAKCANKAVAVGFLPSQARNDWPESTAQSRAVRSCATSWTRPTSDSFQASELPDNSAGGRTNRASPSALALIKAPHNLAAPTRRSRILPTRLRWAAAEVSQRRSVVVRRLGGSQSTALVGRTRARPTTPAACP